jgi:Xaa-Pro aminopeptidase
MARNAAQTRQAVGQKFSLDAMLAARALTFDAVNRIAAAVQPGMTEAQAHLMAEETLQRMGMQRVWHKTIVRFGAGTLASFHEPVGSGRALAANDIFFVDLGVVWNDHEGDAGDTFVVGNDADHQACAEAARTIWRDVADAWRTDRLSGQALYDFAAARADALGYGLHRDVKGHRVSDFPHAIYRAGDLGDFGECPASGLWILEIHIIHKTLGFGAFFEDLLIDQALDA